MSSSTEALSPRGKKVCLLGSGNWGSAIARIIGENVINNRHFDERIPMWVYEEMIDNEKLTEIINTRHENVKYLPGYTIPTNIIAVPNLHDAIQDADILIFCLPHAFLNNLLSQIGKLSNSKVLAISLLKGMVMEQTGIGLISERIEEALGIESCSVLMGANLANEVAKGSFCEATIGTKDLAHGRLFYELFNTNQFQIDVIQDRTGVELCGALKNVVALGAGFVDGLLDGMNTKAAIVRMGLIEMKHFSRRFFSNVQDATFLESCGVADLIATCFGGRHRKCAEEFVKSGDSWHNIEDRLLNGQKLQGTCTIKHVYEVIQQAQAFSEFPLFCRIYQIAFQNANASTLYSLNNVKSIDSL